ncbi:GNAT family N-acetyltransferase [Acinetobacter sp.]|uniref:GNAT family N-acetyltransferase n=1 Tax=Acinetobacter sp. TaxID=472 RepID=UPI002FC80687
MKDNIIRLVEFNDIQNIVDVINIAYRTNQGWTHEFNVVAGDRISPKQLKIELQKENFKLFVLEVEGQILGCIGLTEDADSIEIGSFAILPTHQNAGYGKQLLNFAEFFAKQKQHIVRLNMSVLNIRKELVAYYERHGYHDTHQTASYPLDANVGQPLINLHLLLLSKQI